MKTIQINNKHYEECDVVMLKSNKKATENDIILLKEKKNISSINQNQLALCVFPDSNDLGNVWETQHLYILSNDEIKKGDWFAIKLDDLYDIVKCTKREVKFVWYEKLTVPGVSKIAQPFSIHINLNPKKIIATTDSSLKLHEDETVVESSGFKLKTKDIYLPQIPQLFIEYFIVEYNKGNVISKVLVELQMYKSTVPVTWVSSINDTNVYFLTKLNQNNEISILNKTLFDNNDIEAAKKYIGLPLNKKMDNEERYYNSRHREYDAFLAGIAYEKNKANNLK